LQFLAETDALKLIERANTLSGHSRFENVAEHSWHVSLMSMLFADAAPEGTDHHHVRELLIVHDLVEIYAGDSVIWDVVSESEVFDRELLAAKQLFSMLPDDQASQFQALWREFVDLQTIEARFARALDSLHPMLMSWGPNSQGHPRTDLRPRRVLDRKRQTLQEFPQLWNIAQELVRSAVNRGLLAPDED
jgi:putative hydrolase of HD superfamily